MPGVKVGAVRFTSALENEARENSGLTYLSLAALIRVSLAMCAGYDKEEALRRFARLPNPNHDSDLPPRSSTVRGADDQWTTSTESLTQAH